MSGAEGVRPPLFWRRVLAWLLPRGKAGEAMRGDLEEEFHQQLRAGSPRTARSWYRRQTLGMLFRYLVPGLLGAVRFRSGPLGSPDKRPSPLRGSLADVRHAARRLGRSPAATLIVIGTLAVGIGANTTVFSVIDAVLLEPLPFPDADRLVQIWERNPEAAALSGVTYEDFLVSPMAYQEYSASSDAFASMSYVREYADPPGRITVGGGDGATEVVHAVTVGPSFFDVMGVQPMLGRGFAEDDRGPPGENRWTELSVISYDLWTRRFGADPAVLGSTIELDAGPSTVVGILPPGFELPPLSFRGAPIGHDVDVYLPLTYPAFLYREARQFMVVGRLQPGVTPATAEAQLDRVAERLAASSPDAMDGWSPVVRPLPTIVAREFGAELRIVMTTAALVLLIACINVANLLLAQGMNRRPELALRAALGGSRGRLARLLLTESSLLALAGGAAGLILAWAGTGALVSLIPADVPRASEAGIDGKVLLFTLGASVLTGLVFGLFPALRATRAGRKGLVPGDGGLGRGSTRRRGAAPLLVGAQVTASFVLLVGAGLAAKSFLRLSHRDLGYDPEHLLIVNVQTGAHHPFTGVTMDDAGEFNARWNAAVETLDRIRAVPGVRSVATGSIPTDDSWVGWKRIETEPGGPLEDTVRHFEVEVSPGYFETLGIPVLRGRTFADWGAGDADRYWWAVDPELCARSPEGCAAIVSQSFAERVWPGEDPIGKRLAGWECCFHVVGVVGDVRVRGVDAPSLNAPVDEAFRVYQPYMESGPYLIRTAGPPEQWIEPVREVLRDIYPQAALAFTTQREELARSLARPRFYAAVGVLLAAVALVLAIVGLYGVIAYSVGRRTREIGVRMALGAHRMNVRAMVLRQGMVPVIAGSAAGVLAAFAAGRGLGGLLYGMPTFDVGVTAAVSGLLLGLAGLACYAPARRASNIDPVRALTVD